MEYETFEQFRDRVSKMDLAQLDQLEKDILNEGIADRKKSITDVTFWPKTVRMNVIIEARQRLQHTNRSPDT